VRAGLLLPWLLLPGCGPTAQQLELGRTAATFASEVDPVLRKLYAAELAQCFDIFKAQMPECLEHTRAEWAPVRAGLTKVRAAWCAAEPGKCK
jgi:hypothetical protein